MFHRTFASATRDTLCDFESVEVGKHDKHEKQTGEHIPNPHGGFDPDMGMVVGKLAI